MGLPPEALTTTTGDRRPRLNGKSFIRLPLRVALLAGLLVVGSMSTLYVTPASARRCQARIPPPPALSGCYFDNGAVWQTVACTSLAFIEKNSPEPQALPGIASFAGGSPVPPPFAVSELDAVPVPGAAGSEIDEIRGAPTRFGKGAYSLQGNTFFVCSNRKVDAVQFVAMSHQV